MADETEYKFDEELAQKQANSTEQEYTNDMISGNEFYNTPKLGETDVLIVNKITFDYETTFVDKKDGTKKTKGWVNSKKRLEDGTSIKPHVMKIYSDKGTFNCNFSLYKQIDMIRTAHREELKKGQKMKLKIRHDFDGQHFNLKTEDLQKIKGFPTLAEAETYKIEVQKAVKEGRVFNVSLIEMVGGAK